MRYALVTFGCRVNQADSFGVDDGLRRRGAVEAPADQADLVIVNTCTVTGAADQGARQTIRRLARDNPAARVVVTGCYATREPDTLAGLPNVAAVIPNDRKDELVEWLDAAFPLTTAARFGEGDDTCGGIAPGSLGRTAVPLRVQTGCDESCAYCVIPSTRGASRSRPLHDVLDDARRLAAAGYREAWLVGVHLGAWGRDLPGRPALMDLAAALDAMPGDLTFRLSSLEPMDCPDALVELVAGSGRFAPHFHLPLQHGNDRMLAAMRRPYTVGTYRRLVERIRERLPHAALGSDLIVGFPGESDAAFDDTRRAAEAMPLTALHVFPYSDRPGTAASALSPKVPPAVTAERARVLRAAGRALADGFARAHLGSVRPGLTIDDGTTVVTDNFLRVQIPPGLGRNVRVDVRIDDASGGALRGRVVSPHCFVATVSK